MQKIDSSYHRCGRDNNRSWQRSFIECVECRRTCIHVGIPMGSGQVMLARKNSLLEVEKEGHGWKSRVS